MKIRNFLWPLSATLMLSFCVWAQPSSQSAGAKAENKPPQFDLDQYQFALLKRGAQWTAEQTPEVQKLQAGHMANIQKMGSLGKLMAAGPIGKNDLGLAGIFIFKAASLDEAKALAAEDPAIKAGRLAMDFCTWHGLKGLGAKFNEDYRKDPQTKVTMTKYYLGLLKKGEKWTAQNTPELQRLQLGHLWHIRRMLDAKSYLTAGPFSGHPDVLGIVVIAADNLDAAKAIAEADPAVQAGHHRVEYVEWYVAKEVWP
ncbi:MAG TPA: YciI family protein [Blastocatellia bacterium]|nr:YciI family protein [Blastocatellia bacterium]